MKKTLGWMSSSMITELNASVEDNLERYRSGDFDDLVSLEWSQTSVLEYEENAFAGLSGDSSNDLEDSLLVFEALKELPPNLATSMNVWVPLLHTELLPYARKRWLNKTADNEVLTKAIQTRFFKGGRTGYRDDNAIARLWWSGYIGSRIAQSKNPAAIRDVLAPLMRTTDTRQSVVERPGIFTEVGLAKSISDYVAAGKLPDHEKDAVFRQFMISINLKSNGRYFGDVLDAEMAEFFASCH